MRIILANLKPGTNSHASIAVGTQLSLTVGFAQEWLNWKDEMAAKEVALVRDRAFAEQAASAARAVAAAERAAAAAERQAEQAQRANRVSLAALIVAFAAAIMSLIALARKIS